MVRSLDRESGSAAPVVSCADSCPATHINGTPPKPLIVCPLLSLSPPIKGDTI